MSAKDLIRYIASNEYSELAADEGWNSYFTCIKRWKEEDQWACVRGRYESHDGRAGPLSVQVLHVNRWQPESWKNEALKQKYEGFCLEIPSKGELLMGALSR